jgi:hypothetical protein
MSLLCDNAAFYPTTETQIAPNVLLDGLLGHLVKHADTENLHGPIDSSCSFVVAVSLHMEVFYRDLINDWLPCPFLLGWKTTWFSDRLYIARIHSAHRI